MAYLGAKSDFYAEAPVTVLIEVACPSCKSTDVVKNGSYPNGEQRYYCKNSDCERSSFMLHYSNKGCLPQTKSAIIEMAMNGSGIRDTARVLEISPDTVLSELKKKRRALRR
jgi:insertion element IS1 protein InsB